MKIHFQIICISCLLLFTIGYTQILHRIIIDKVACTAISDCGEEPLEKSSEENSYETDQDEDPFRISEMAINSSENSKANSRIESYVFGLLCYFPEIVSPPPQA